MDEPHVGSRVDRLERALTRQTLAVLATLVLAALLAPAARWTFPTERPTTLSGDERLNVLEVVIHQGTISDRFSDRADAYPFAIGVATVLVLVAAILVLIAIVAAVAAIAARATGAPRRASITARIAETGLVVGAIALWIGLRWLPEPLTEGSAPTLAPAWGLWAVLAAGAWLVVHHDTLFDPEN